MKRIISVALVLLMVFAFATAVTAATDDSPTGKEYYKITVKTEGDGSATSDKNRVEVENVDDIVTLRAVSEGGTFINWVIDGDYDPITGDVNSDTFVIRAKSDITATAVFEGGATEVVKPTSAPNTGNTSPKTGDPTFLVIALMLAALGMGAFAVKKIKE